MLSSAQMVIANTFFKINLPHYVKLHHLQNMIFCNIRECTVSFQIVVGFRMMIHYFRILKNMLIIPSYSGLSYSFPVVTVLRCNHQNRAENIENRKSNWQSLIFRPLRDCSQIFQNFIVDSVESAYTWHICRSHVKWHSM